MFIRFHRRDFLKISMVTTLSLMAGGLVVSRFFKKSITVFKGSIVGANAKIGHMMRLGSFQSPKEILKVDTVIVGAGMAGLSAGWWLNKHQQDFIMLELDKTLGGNSQSGANAVGPYPWGAHYVPIPGEDAEYVKILFKELGIIKKEVEGVPVFNEYYLCSDPHERLYFQGTWRDGLLPQYGVTDVDLAQYKEFFAHVEDFKNRLGKDGKRLFNIPMDLSSRDDEFMALDKISMTSYMSEKGWSSTPLNWYVNYCCRDDYGQTAANVSAWAGLHYFCSRAGKATNSDPQTVITWPQGNGWLVEKISMMFSEKIKTNSLVYSIKQQSSGGAVLVDYHDIESKKNIRIEARNVIYAGPRYTAKYVIKSAVGELFTKDLAFSPWVIGNITLSSPPAGKGQELSWDNVSYYSPSLGYIVSNHQNLNSVKNETIITYYLPLTDGDHHQTRKEAFGKDHGYWADLIVKDLEKMHPQISETIIQLDVWVWGHGLVGPGLNYLWSEDRQKMKASLGNIHFAHTDMSGISIFEEAQYQGVLAAQKVMGKKQS